MDTRELLTDSTRALLRNRGLDGTSPKDLHRAGAGQGNMYDHSCGKRDRLAAPGHAVEHITEYPCPPRAVPRGCPPGGLTQDLHVMGDVELLRPIEETSGRPRPAGVPGPTARPTAGSTGEADPVATAASVVAVMQGGHVLAHATQDESRFDQAATGMAAASREGRARCRSRPVNARDNRRAPVRPETSRPQASHCKTCHHPCHPGTTL
jgi:hypothetical protein